MLPSPRTAIVCLCVPGAPCTSRIGRRAASHPRAEDAIVFNETEHTYVFHSADGGCITARCSVTGLIRAMTNDTFDPIAVSLRMCRGDALAARKLRSEWDATRDAGTHVHNCIQHLLERKVPLGPHDTTRDARVNMAMDFLRAEALGGWRPCRSEMIIVAAADDGESFVAGTLDLLLRNATTGAYRLVDWKTTKVPLASTSAPTHAAKLEKWAAQLRIYALMLRDHALPNQPAATAGSMAPDLRGDPLALQIVELCATEPTYVCHGVAACSGIDEEALMRALRA